jgi:predicted HicB family RNase H-like nuclease
VSNRTHDGAVRFRANDQLIAALAAQARASGYSVSEYLRAIVREKVGLQ